MEWQSMIITTFILHMLRPFYWRILFLWSIWLTLFVYNIYIYIYIYFSRLKPFITKSEIADIGVLKWVPSYALYRIKYQYVKNVRYSFLLQQKIEREENFYNIVTDIQQVLKIWEMKRLTLGGKVVILTQ